MLGFLSALIFVFFTGSTARPIYRNTEFGITLRVPMGAMLCTPPKSDHDHGPYMLLSTANKAGCHDLGHHRSISIFASYNAAAETKTLARLLQSDCREVARASCQSAPANLSIPGLRTSAGMAGRPGGWVDVFVVAQAGKPDPEFDPSVPSVNYELALRSRRPELQTDLGVFREVLRTIHISPPTP